MFTFDTFRELSRFIEMRRTAFRSLNRSELLFKPILTFFERKCQLLLTLESLLCTRVEREGERESTG